MKARTKAQKIKAKRGRPFLPGNEREPNGQLSRRKASRDTRQQQTEGKNMDVAVNRRIRQFDLKDYRDKGGRLITAEQQAADPRHGYVLGRMLIDGTVTKEQHDIGIRIGEDMARFYGLTGVPFPSARAQDLFAVRGSGGDDSEGRAKAARKARDKANALRDAFLACGDINTGRKVAHTVMQVCVLDVDEARKWPNHMMLWLRHGLNAAGKVYGAV